MTQLPDRATIGGGGNIKKAAAEIFTKVKKDNVAAEERRRIKDQARAARAGSRNGTASPPPRAIRPTVELEEPESDEQETRILMNHTKRIDAFPGSPRRKTSGRGFATMRRRKRGRRRSGRKEMLG
jgi:hypothetical protein